jgi:N6-adenosine-specific RNA methylase IME4
MNNYQVIYADPPWKYNNRANHKTRFRGGASGHYALMTMDAIKALPVASIAAPDAVLFMWVTFPYLKEQLEVFEAWGFSYKTVAFTWIKLNPQNYWPFFGVGHYTKSNAELCLFGTRGKVLKPAVNDVSSVILAPRREHSRKPDEARAGIERLYPTASRVELFAREKAAGWDVFGNEVESDVVFAEAI